MTRLPAAVKGIGVRARGIPPPGEALTPERRAAYTGAATEGQAGMHIAMSAGGMSPEEFSPEREHWLDLGRRLERRFPEIQLSRIEAADPLPQTEANGDTLRAGRGGGPWARLRFEQIDLPRAALAAGADLLFIPYPNSPLRSGVPVIAAGRDVRAADGAGAVERVRRSLGRAGLRGAAAVVVFADQPPPVARGIHFVTLPPGVGPAFRPVPAPDDMEVRSRLGVPDACVLCLAPPTDRLEFLLAAWTWVDGSVGDSIPLVVAALPSEAREPLRLHARTMDVAGSVRMIEEVTLTDLPALFRGAQAYLDAGGPSVQALRWALACGVPVAAMESAPSAAALEDSAYLAAPDDSRALGAACLTLLVEP
ncbi:MAG: hypothetical protein ACRDHY_14825, partial [Anaerolineales bacterium]